MNCSSNHHNQVLRELIEKSLEGTISPAEWTRLEQCIVQDPEQRQYYCQYLHLTIGLMRLCDGVTPPIMPQQDQFNFESLWDALIAEEKTAPAVPGPESPDGTLSKDSPSAGQKTPAQKVNTTWLGVAAICTTALLLILTAAHLYQVFIPSEVATLSKSLNATLGNGSTWHSGMRLTNHKELLHLQTGVMEIIFDSGAKVMLEAPAEFRLMSTRRMALQSGQLFAVVPHFAQGFTVVTPQSRVTDMGTEFGIQVGQDGSSDVHMFKGKAALQSNAGPGPGQPVTLTSGQAKRVDKSGRIKDIPMKRRGFVQHFNEKTAFIWRGQRLDLTDLIGKGNGLGTGRTNVFLDPIAGYNQALYCEGKGNAYHPIFDNPMIDGLFIPDGRRQQTVSSAGHVFRECPETNGQCYANLAANPKPGLYSADQANTLTVRVVDPSAQGTPAFVLASETHLVTGQEAGMELMPVDWSQDRLGTGTWVHFRLGTPVPLEPNKQYGFDVTVTSGNSGFYLEVAGMNEDGYASGAAYSTGVETGTNSLRLDEVYHGDRTFIAALSPRGTDEPATGGLDLSYHARTPHIGPDDVYFLEESTVDNQNVGGFSGQTYSGDNDRATYISRDRRGLGQTFTTGNRAQGYTMTGFWLKNVAYTENLSGGNGTWWYVGAQRRNGVMRFNGQEYGNREHPCIMMHANLGITFDLDAIRSLCPDITVSHFVSKIGVADFDEAAGCNADFWVLVDGQVRASERNVTHKGMLHDISVALTPTDRFLTLATTDGGDVDQMGDYQRAYTCDWCVFAHPAFTLEKEEGTADSKMP